MCLARSLGGARAKGKMKIVRDQLPLCRYSGSHRAAVRERAGFAVPARLSVSFRTMPVVPVALAVLVLGGYALHRRLDIRLVLIAAAAALFALRASRPEVAGQRIN